MRDQPSAGDPRQGRAALHERPAAELHGQLPSPSWVIGRQRLDSSRVRGRRIRDQRRGQESRGLTSNADWKMRQEIGNASRKKPAKPAALSVRTDSQYGIVHLFPWGPLTSNHAYRSRARPVGKAQHPTATWSTNSMLFCQQAPQVEQVPRGTGIED